MPLSTTLLTTCHYATASAFLYGAGWSIKIYSEKQRKIKDQEEYDLETKCCPTWEELKALRAAKAIEEGKKESS